MKKLFSVLRMCETSILQSKWLELERCSYPDRLSPYHRLDGYSVIVEPGKEEIFREWVNSHVSTTKVEDDGVDYVDAIVPVLSMLTGKEFYSISEAMLAYYSDFDAMMHYCAYSPEAERLNAFGEEVIPIVEEELPDQEIVPIPQPVMAPEAESVIPEVKPIVPEIKREVILQPVPKAESVSSKFPTSGQETILPSREENVATELFTDGQIRRIVAYLLTLDSEEVVLTFLRSLQDAYCGEDRHGITTLLLRIFDRLSAKEQEG